MTDNWVFAWDDVRSDLPKGCGGLCLDLGYGNGHHLLFVGSLYPRKGVTTLIEAFAILAQQNVVLHLVGDMAKNQGYIQRLQEMVAEYGVDGRVILHGNLSHEELSPLYRQADIFVLPSL